MHGETYLRIHWQLRDVVKLMWGRPCRRMAAEEFRGSRAAALLVMYSEAAAHLICAASDIVLVPSLFEPCVPSQICRSFYDILSPVMFSFSARPQRHGAAQAH